MATKATSVTNDENATLQQEEILMKEGDILAGLLSLHKEAKENTITRRIKIMRDKKVVLEFRVRPLSEEESQDCHRKATKYARTKPGQPKVAIETNSALFRSMLIYTATVDEDRAKLWDNKKAMDAMQLLRGVDMVDSVLRAGEKSRILSEIDEISGFSGENDEDPEDLAGN